MLIYILYVLSAQARLGLANQVQTSVMRLAARCGPLRRFAALRRGFSGHSRGKDDGVSSREE